jgi:hypothetical protein
MKKVCLSLLMGLMVQMTFGQTPTKYIGKASGKELH